MKKSKKILTAALLAAAAGMLGGCAASETKESILKTMTETMQKVESYGTVMNMDMEMAVQSLGFSMDMKLGGDFDMDITMDPQASYMKGNFEIEVLGQKQPMAMELYSVQEGEGMVVYTNMSGMGMESGWTKTSEEGAGIDVAEMTKFFESFQDETVEKMISNMELQEETTKIGGEECYVLIGTETGDMVEPIMDYMEANMGEALAGLGEGAESIDWSKLEVPVELYVNKDKKYLMQMNMDLKDMMDYLMSAVGELETAGMEISFESCKVEMSFDSFNEIEAITVPEDVKASAVEQDLESLQDQLETEAETTEAASEDETEEKVEIDI